MEILAAIGWALAVLAGGALVLGQQKLSELKLQGEAALGAARERAEAAVRKAMADRDDTVSRVRRSIEDQRRYAHEPLVKDLLVVVDDFERALEHMAEDDPGAEGVRAIHANLLASLKRHGVVRVGAVGERFNPDLHEAVGLEASPLPENTVVREWGGGYRLHERLLRAAKVVLATAPVDEEPVEHEQTDERVLLTPPPGEE